VPADFNNDSVVDAADYVVWRKIDGTQAGYDLWRAHFGKKADNGSAASLSMYGDSGQYPAAGAGANYLTGMTNVEVADFYSDLFRRKKKEAEQLGLGGPPKTDAQVMAVALATYVTNLSLAGSTAQSFGFLVTAHGVGTTTFNVGNNGEAFNVADNSLVAVLDLLFATNENLFDGVMYDVDHDGDADGDWEATLRTLANDVYSAINEAGDI
jgi:hypothetical protein